MREPDQDEDEQDFEGKDLEHVKLVKLILKFMGFKNRDDRDAIIKRIKVSIRNEEDDPTDRWGDKCSDSIGSSIGINSIFFPA